MERCKVRTAIARFRAIMCREHSRAFKGSYHYSIQIRPLLSGHRTAHSFSWAILALGIFALPVPSYHAISGHGDSGVGSCIDRMVSCDSLSHPSSSVSYHNSVFTVCSAVSSIDWSCDAGHASSSPLWPSLSRASRFRPPLMAAAVRTLDISDPQVIVEYPLDAGGSTGITECCCIGSALESGSLSRRTSSSSATTSMCRSTCWWAEQLPSRRTRHSTSTHTTPSLRFSFGTGVGRRRSWRASSVAMRLWRWRTCRG